MTSKTFPKLYKKSAKGIQEWTVSVDNNRITVSHGQLGGKTQSNTETIKEGKNLGKANATTPEQQALAEAESKFTKQLSKGYCKTLEDCQNGILDEVIEGGIAPMLAPNKCYPTFAHKLTFPVICQPKLDGSRLISKDGLWSRTRKRVNSLPHILKAIKEQLGENAPDLDGEAWSKDVALSEGFEGLMSIIRKDEPTDGHEQIGYYIYDLPSSNKNNFERDKERLNFLQTVKWPLVLVESTICQNYEDIKKAHEKNLAEGYEGTMIRGDGPYEQGKRSYFLQKLKDFEDHEFGIIGMEEGRGKDAGTLGAFLCKTADGKEFKCRLKATYERRRELFKDSSQWKGFKLTVKHQGFTSDGIPRFPIGKALRRGEE